MAPPPTPPPGKKAAWSAAETEALRRLIRRRSKDVPPAGKSAEIERSNVHGCLNCTTDAPLVEPRCSSTLSEAKTPRAVGPVTALCTDTRAVPSSRKTRTYGLKNHAPTEYAGSANIGSVQSFLSSDSKPLQPSNIFFGFSQKRQWNGGTVSSGEASKGLDLSQQGGELYHLGEKRQKLHTSHSLNVTPPIRNHVPSLLAVPFRTRPQITIPLSFSDTATPSSGTDGTVTSPSSGCQIRPSISRSESVSSELNGVTPVGAPNSPICGYDFFPKCMSQKLHVTRSDPIGLMSGCSFTGGSVTTFEDLGCFSYGNVTTAGPESGSPTGSNKTGVAVIDDMESDFIKFASRTGTETRTGIEEGTGTSKKRAAVSGSQKLRNYSSKRSLLSYLSAGWPKLKIEGSRKGKGSSAKNLPDVENGSERSTIIEMLGILLEKEQSTYSEMQETLDASTIMSWGVKEVLPGEVLLPDPAVHPQIGVGSVADNGNEYFEKVGAMVNEEVEGRKLEEGARRVCPEIGEENNSNNSNNSNNDNFSKSSMNSILGSFFESSLGSNCMSNSESSFAFSLDLAPNFDEKAKPELMSNLEMDSILDLGLLDIPIRF